MNHVNEVLCVSFGSGRSLVLCRILQCDTNTNKEECLMTLSSKLS